METGKWGTGRYLESLHRTYGKALPKRDDGHFERALEFRMREKEHFYQLEQENNKLRYLLQQARRDHTQLLEDAGILYNSWDTNNKQIMQLSKSSANDDVPSASSSSSVLPDKANSSRGDDGGVSSNRKGRSKGSNDEVPGEVLPPELPIASGHSKEHTREGRQHECGDGEGGDATREEKAD